MNWNNIIWIIWYYNRGATTRGISQAMRFPRTSQMVNFPVARSNKRWSLGTQAIYQLISSSVKTLSKHQRRSTQLIHRIVVWLWCHEASAKIFLYRQIFSQNRTAQKDLTFKIKLTVLSANMWRNWPKIRLNISKCSMVRWTKSQKTLSIYRKWAAFFLKSNLKSK